MVGLADIAPLTETVVIRGKKIEVTGIDLLDIPKLLTRFPILVEIVSSGNWGMALLNQPADLVGAVIAAGCGKLGDDAAEKGARNLKLGEMTKLFEAIIQLTGPEAIGPLLVAAAAAMRQNQSHPQSHKLKPLPPGAVRVRSMKSSQQASMN